MSERDDVFARGDGLLRKPLKYSGKSAVSEQVLRLRLRQKLRQWRNRALVGAMLAGGLTAGVKGCFENKDKNVAEQSVVAQRNMQNIAKIQAEIMTAIAYVEGFSDKPYFCGAKQTIGYGSTYYPNGEAVGKNDKAISCKLPVKYYKGAEFKKGREYVCHHLQKEVYPFIEKYVTRDLSKNELLGVVLFVYNVGGENFSGHKKNGKVCGKESAFLQALNKGDALEDCAVKMTGFRAMNGKRANGLLKRHWVAMALFCDKISAQDLLKLKATGFYDIKDLSFFYKKEAKTAADYWEPDFSAKKIKQFLLEQAATGEEKGTKNILDDEVLSAIKKSASFDLAAVWHKREKQH